MVSISVPEDLSWKVWMGLNFKAECQEHKICDSVCLLHLALETGTGYDENKSILTNELE